MGLKTRSKYVTTTRDNTMQLMGLTKIYYYFSWFCGISEQLPFRSFMQVQSVRRHACLSSEALKGMGVYYSFFTQSDG